jgi:hypothetical protein
MSAGLVTETRGRMNVDASVPNAARVYDFFLYGGVALKP